jgi:glutamine cyclotransferase
MLTWRESALLIYDRATLQSLGTKTIKTYNGEGWGLAYDGRQLIASDGSQYLSFYDIPADGVKTVLPVGFIVYF